MARSSREQAEKHREAIEAASSRLFRERGLNGISVAELMGSAGLTHGGFYSHFDSKDALAAIACGRAFAESAQRWDRRLAEAGDDRHAMRERIAGPYLSARHRDDPGGGCPAVAMCVDVAREAADKPVRQAFRDGLQQLVAQWERTIDEADPAVRRRRAMAELAAMTGAVMLARATVDSPDADDFLAGMRELILGAGSAEAAEGG
ncbi:TetR family transcriptional regulator [Cupriavidus sp. USMAA2-4]|uniref:TetR family transcriptional regulator n=1 Tax=Cupriavidus malaysiensis TaxID=367825 RepID=A0ABN4THX4_9BURK|nr:MULTISPECIES: TetR/AcrR family transcriptional regulator [Cupriavidus]AOY91943.1 TetR family transcriptional regulator [Cupriavidus sp. USMAA2-4]AOY98498.1 TetR family transcriptional regulator [Cupriavidus sp. USMAHM13]AOZ04928.1 TetR family transcriptional regulator [Cupriavidus malaysiensis]